MTSRGELRRYAAWVLLLLAAAALLLRLMLGEQFGWIPSGTSAALVVLALVVQWFGRDRPGARR